MAKKTKLESITPELFWSPATHEAVIRFAGITEEDRQTAPAWLLASLQQEDIYFASGWTFGPPARQTDGKVAGLGPATEETAMRLVSLLREHAPADVVVADAAGDVIMARLGSKQHAIAAGLVARRLLASTRLTWDRGTRTARIEQFPELVLPEIWFEIMRELRS